MPFGSLTSDINSRLGAHDPSIDIFEADSPNVPYYAARGFLSNLDSERRALKAHLSATSLVPVSYKGSVWAFPLWTSDAFLYYNKALLRKYGVAAPSSNPSRPITWEQLADDAAKAVAKHSQTGISIEQVNAYYQLQPLVASLGGGTGLAGPKLLTPNITTTPWVKAMQFYQSLFKRGLTIKGEGFSQASNLFIDKQTPFFIGGPWDIGAFDHALGKTGYGIAPQPRFSGGRQATPTDSESIGLSPYSPHRTAALKFLEFMCLTKQGASLTSNIGYPVPPVNKAALGSFLSALSADGHQAAAKLLTYDLAHTAVHRPVTVGYVQFEADMDKAFTNIMDGAAVLPSLRAATKQIRTSFAQLGL